MSEQTEDTKHEVKKPWYKTWWGFILLIIVWPITITVWVWNNKSWSKKNKIIALSIFWILIISLSQTGDNTAKVTSNDEPQILEQPEVQATPNPEENSQKNQELVLSFEQQLFETEKNAAQAIESFKEASANFETSDATTFDLYQLAKNAKEESKVAQLAYGRMSIPKELPNDVKKELEGSASDMSTAYFTKGQALDLAMQYLDESKPSLLSEYTEKIKLADQFTLTAVSKLFKAKEMVGLPLVEDSSLEE
jgi:hypothetical protein